MKNRSALCCIIKNISHSHSSNLKHADRELLAISVQQKKLSDMGNAKLLMELETKISQVIDTTLFNDDVYALLICTLLSIDKKRKKNLDTHY